MKSKFLNVTVEDYRADKLGLKVPTLNYSTAKVILAKSPLHAWIEREYPKPAKRYMDVGQILHMMLLTKGAKAQIIEDGDWQPENYKTKKAQQFRDEAIEKNLIPLLRREYDEIIKAAATVSQQLTDAGISLEGYTEKPLMWEEDGVWCRGCPDLYEPAPVHDITELKFTDWPLTESSLRRLIRTQGYDIQLATYTAGVHIITGEKPRFRWIFCEMQSPYQIRVVRPSDLLLQVGTHKWDKARNAWKECLASGKWTGYGTAELEIDPDYFELRENEISVYPPAEVIGDSEYAEPSTDEMWEF